jgi:type II secretory pathway predicted ATPase ExeA
MLPNYFNLTEEPFGVTPDPRFLFLGKQHREAMASLAYGTESNRGFLALIAKPGMGKTSLLYHYLEWLRGKARTAFVFRTDCDSRELIRHILLDLGVDAPSNDLPAMHDSLNKILTEEMNRGRRFVLVIDEAQNLDEKTLESVRLLSNFETPWKKLMQIVIAGQPGLAEKLARPSLTQLRQRISMVMRLEPLNLEETCSYIDHRLWVVGCKDLRLFTPGARASIAASSQGIPRNINNICFNAMSLACAMKRKTIDREIVRDVLADLDIESLCYKDDVDSNQHVVSAPVADGPAPTEQRPRLAVLRTWFPRMVGASVAALVFCGTVGGFQQDVRRTVQAESALAAPSSSVNMVSPVILEKPLVEPQGASAITLPGEPSLRIGKNDREISDPISSVDDLLANFDGGRRSRTAASLGGLPEYLLRLIDPRTISRSAEAESNE